MVLKRILDWKAQVWIYYCGSPESIAYKPDNWQHEIYEEIDDKFKESLSKWGIYAKKMKEIEIIDAATKRFELDTKLTLCIKIKSYGFKVKEEFMKGEEEIVTGVTYRILRMAARPKFHIYGLSDTEFYKRMSERKEKYTKRQSDELLKLFKEGLIKTKAKI